MQAILTELNVSSSQQTGGSTYARGHLLVIVRALGCTGASGVNAYSRCTGASTSPAPVTQCALRHLQQQLFFLCSLKRCDAGWEGQSCRIPTSNLPTDLKDDFSSPIEDLSASQYVRVVGGVIDDACGNMGYQTALHFNQVPAKRRQHFYWELVSINCLK